MQHVHDEDTTIGTCVREGPLREQVRKRIVSRAAGEMLMALCAGSSRLSRQSTEFDAIAQVCALQQRQGCMCARACGHAHGPGAADEHGNLPPTPLPPSRFNPGNGRGLRELADTAHKKYGKTIKSMVQDSNRRHALARSTRHHNVGPVRDP